MKSYSVEEALAEIGQDVKKLTDEAVKRARQGVQLLAVQTHALILQKAQSKLNATRKKYLENLSVDKIYSGEDQEIWAVSLKKDAGWIEEGYPAGSMIDRILNNGKPPKKSKDGSEYKTIPFEHSKPKSDMSAAQVRIANYAKSQIKKQGLDKVITDEAGKPKLGKVATVKIDDKKQPISKFNKPLLSGLTIYQREVKTASGKTKIKRDIFTFRTISSKHKGSGLWETKGYDGAKIFDEVSDEVDKMWSEMIKDILK